MNIFIIYMSIEIKNNKSSYDISCVVMLLVIIYKKPIKTIYLLII